jgi:hypothetical protein
MQNALQQVASKPVANHDRKIEFSVYHEKGGPETARKMVLRPYLTGLMPTGSVVCERLLTQLGVEEPALQQKAESPDTTRPAVLDQDETYILRNVTKGREIPPGDRVDEHITEGDVVEITRRSTAG